MKSELLEYFNKNLGNLKSIKDEKLIKYLDSIFPNIQYTSKNYTRKVKAMMVILDLEDEPKCIVCESNVELLPSEYKFSPQERKSKFFSWKPYCSQKCAHSSKLVVEKRKLTTKERYGAESWAQSTEGKIELSKPWEQDKKDKYNESYKKTSLFKYGVEHYSKTEEYLKKREETTLENFGVKNAFQLVEKIKSTNLSRYGVEYYQQSAEGKEKLSKNNGMKNPDTMSKSRMSRMLSTIKDDILRYCIINDDKIKLVEYLDSLNCNNRYELSKAIQLSNSYLNSILRRFDMRELYLGKSNTNPEIEIFNFIKSIYSGEVIMNNRTILPGGRELDIFLPDLNLAIEYNGLYWHSEGRFGKDATYHLGKTNDCENLGIQLLHIFENEWQDHIKRDIWKSIIRNKLKLSENRYYARKCTIKEIESSVSREFLERTHLSGFVGASIHLGMYHNDELVSVLSYGKSRFEDKLEIIRYASKLNSNIIGGFGKFYKLLPNDIITYADRRYSSSMNSVYGKFFNSSSKTTPNWFGFSSDFELKSRWAFQKHIISKDPRYIDGLPILDNLINIGYDRIWDCGNLKFWNE